jgi:hypothetical protein
MNVKVNWKDNVQRYWAIVSGIWAFGSIFLILFAIMVFQTLNSYNLTQEASAQRDKLQGEVSYFYLAQQLASSNVDGYNEVLRRLIPESEDYFSIIASLERLSLRTGLKISRYTIDLPENNSDKFTLSIVGTVTPEEFDRFLRTYKFGTGRLVTIENLQITNQTDNNIRLTMNFYSKQVTTSNLVRVGSLSEKDLQLMSEIARTIRESEAQANNGQGVPPGESIVPDSVQ